jgi:hypothetical protein
MKANGSVTEQHRGTESDAVANKLLQTFKNATKRGRSGCDGTLSDEVRINLASEFRFDLRIERKNFKFVIFAEQRLDQGSTERLARSLHESDLTLVCGGGIEKSLQNRAEIANGDLFAKELLQDLLDFTEGEETGHKLVD